jgi:hypothetical protein
MATIKITAIVFSSPPTASLPVDFRYRETVGPGAWIQLNGGIAITVPISGTLTTPLLITGLAADTSYDIGAQSKCGTVEFVATVVSASEFCPNITNIETLIIN